MVVRIEKRNDGASILRCTRSDGTSDWQKRDPHGEFFALHDLTHFAVETVLGATAGFFGLVARGWTIEETTGKGARGPLPAEAVAVEHLVGMLDAERAGSTLWSAAEFNQANSAALPITESELLAIRARRAELVSQWTALAPGETLELTFSARGVITPKGR